MPEDPKPLPKLRKPNAKQAREISRMLKQREKQRPPADETDDEREIWRLLEATLALRG